MRAKIIGMKFGEVSEKEFDKFERKQKVGNFFQSTKRAELRKRMGYDAFLLGVTEKDKILAVGMLVVRNEEAWLQLGPILDYKDKKLVEFFISELVKFAKKKNFTALEVFPPVLLSVRDVHGEKLKEDEQEELFAIFKKLGFEYEGRTVKLENKANRWMCIKDLSDFKDMDEVRASFKKNVRNKLRKVKKELEVHVLEDKSELNEWIKPLNDSNEKNGVHGRNVKYYEDIWDIFGDEVQFMVVRKKENKELVSARVVFYQPQETVTFVSGTIQKNRRLNGMTVMQEWQMEECLKRGQKRLNFYGLEGDFSKANKLLEFKSGFGVEIEEYIGGFKMVLRPVKYHINNLKKKLWGGVYHLIKK